MEIVNGEQIGTHRRAIDWAIRDPLTPALAPEPEVETFPFQTTAKRL